MQDKDGEEYTIEELKVLDIQGLMNDAAYWDMRRTYGDDSEEVRMHMQYCARSQGLID
jgi:hypothetical protein